MRIRIKSTPPGTAAPGDIRALWVGIVLESSGREQPTALQEGARFGSQNLGGYQVDTAHAFERLKEHSPKAYQWWDENWGFAALGSTLIFHADACEEVPESI